MRLSREAVIADREHHRQLVVGVFTRRERLRHRLVGVGVGVERNQAPIPANHVDGAIFCGLKQPGFRIIWQREAPRLHGGHQRVVNHVFYERQVRRTEEASQGRGEVHRLAPEQLSDELAMRWLFRRHRGYGPLGSSSGRTSTEPSNSKIGQPCAKATASSSEAATRAMLPVIISFDSTKGPSVTTRSRPRTVLPPFSSGAPLGACPASASDSRHAYHFCR